jgi:hypothetical protein
MTDNLTTLMCRLSENPGSLTLLEPSGPTQACTWIALPTPFTVADSYTAPICPELLKHKASPDSCQSYVSSVGFALPSVANVFILKILCAFCINVYGKMTQARGYEDHLFIAGQCTPWKVATSSEKVV